ncbi:MAG: UDP-N-acetylmuramoyl-tripeptide--D-alanyl-D-alanine ligase [Legionellales bacterium]|nr:UDP-N-acetylmuramoyl-tripeptide--D-alanyl-D-alanine ligase [Legionellales bacterium]|tara:strand:+ start:287 stop:1624 length:1338 start_codon:yes stop_codon:yes gene_type:complete
MLEACADWISAEGTVSGPFKQLSLDTRTLQPGDLFIALKGPHFDGHDYVQTAFERGAAAAIIDQDVQTQGPCLKVENTSDALNMIGRQYRTLFSGSMIGITGSCGKTTTRHMIATVLNPLGSVLETAGNLNNHYGVPLMLSRLKPKHAYAVLECGASGIGEIEPLAQLIQPHVAVITNVHPAHLERFKQLDNIATTKGALFSALNASGIAVMPQDSPYRPLWSRWVQSQRIITFGLTAEADVYAEAIEHTPAGISARFITPQDQWQGLIPIWGIHHLLNVLAAIAVGVSFNHRLESMMLAMQTFQSVSGRMSFQSGYRAQLNIINDAYNANPVAFKAAIDVLIQQPGQHIVVMGDMLELGDEAQAYHQALGEYMQQAGIDELFTVGALSRYAAQAYGVSAQCFEDLNTLSSALKERISSGEITVLVKGSRASGLDQVVERLCHSV